MSNLVKINDKELNLPIDINNYWARRMHLDLYRCTVALAHALFFNAKSAIDVGCYTSGILCELDWIDRRVATDLQLRLAQNWEHVPGVEFVGGDAFALDFTQYLEGTPKLFDLVISNQMVEHLDQPVEFIEKLISLGRGLIVSTTYETPAGLIEGHIQDPISLEKFKSWFPCELDAWFICRHPTNQNIKQIVGYLKDSHPNAKAR